MCERATKKRVTSSEGAKNCQLFFILLLYVYMCVVKDNNTFSMSASSHTNMKHFKE